MSFSTEIKSEILNNKIENSCCKISFITGIIKTISELSLEHGELYLEFKTDNIKLLNKLNELFTEIFGEVGNIEIDKDTTLKKTERYVLRLDNDLTLKVLIECNLMDSQHEINTIDHSLNYITENECCKRSFIIGVFIGCATTNIILKSLNPNLKHSSGYHLEFVLNDEDVANELLELLKEDNISAKIAIRKKQYLVYIKEVEQISDMLAFVGANNAVMQLQNEIAIREVRNTINRQNNCLSGNISKTIDASMRQIESIEIIEKKIGLESLDEDLEELCLLRIANPDEPLVNLIKLYSKPISKSGINYRFSKIEKIAFSLLDI